MEFYNFLIKLLWYIKIMNLLSNLSYINTIREEENMYERIKNLVIFIGINNFIYINPKTKSNMFA